MEKRISYIAGELKRKEDLMAELDKKQVRAGNLFTGFVKSFLFIFV